MIDLELTDEHRDVRDAVRAFARRELSDRGLSFRERWRHAADLGVQRWSVPAELGGDGADAMTTAVAMEALGYGCPDNGLLFALGAQIWAVQHPLVRHGSEEQRRRYLPGLLDGSLVGAHAMTEPDSGSDAFAFRTTASARGDRYILQGTKAYVTNAPEADVLLVFARTGGGSGFGGVCAFLVERETPGLSVGAPPRTMGLETAPAAEVVLDGCEVPAGAMLGRRGTGLAAFLSAMELERGFILAGAVGTMERTLEDCIRYARQRRQFGRPIGSFQAVSHRIVDMKLRLETARLLLYRLARRIDQGRSITLDSALVKLHLSESLLQTTLDAVQLHGAYGYTADGGLEEQVRDAVAGRLYSGTSELQRNIVARQLGLGGHR